MPVAFLIKMPEFIQIIIYSRQLYTQIVSWVTTPVVAKSLREIAPPFHGRCRTTPKMEAVCSTEKFVTTSQNTRFHKPEDNILVTRGENGTSIAVINIPHFALPNNQLAISFRTFTSIPVLQNQITCRSHRSPKVAL